MWKQYVFAGGFTKVSTMHLWPVSVSNVTGVMNWVAFLVMMTSTSAPSLRSALDVYKRQGADGAGPHSLFLRVHRLHPDGVQYAGAAQCAAVSVLHGGGLCTCLLYTSYADNQDVGSEAATHSKSA